MVWCWVVVFSGLILPSCCQAASQVIELSEAAFTVSGGDRPPSLAAWQPVQLTHRWTAQDYAQGRNGWYRLVLDLPQAPAQHWGIYLRRFNMNAAVFLNGQFLTDGGSFDEPLSRNWNRPLYATVPSSLWRSGENIIHIRLKSYAGYGYLTPVFVGPTAILDQEFARQNLLQIEISQALFPITLAIGLFVLGLWIRRRKDVQYFWFAAAVLVWSLYSLNMAIQNQPFSIRVWEWIAHSSVDWWVILFAIFVHRFTAISRPWLERVFLLFGVSASLVYAVVNMETLNQVTRWFHGGSLLIGLYVTLALIRIAYRERNRYYAGLALGMTLLLLMGVNDWLFQFRVTGVTGPISLHLSHYFSPLLFFFMAWHLTGRFVTALNESETLNRELEERVLQAQCEIEQHYQTIQEMEKHQAVLQERERLSREIHDGISGNVANAIMMTELIHRELPSADDKRLRQLRAHLDDGLCEMRNLILTMEEDLSTLGELLNHVNDKYEQVLSSLGIDFQADIQLQDETRVLTQEQSLNLLRILQEALNNIAKHAQASTVSLRVSEAGGRILFEVHDNGRGFDTNQQSSGHYGLGNMRKRSDEIAASLVINSTLDAGTQIQLALLISSSPCH